MQVVTAQVSERERREAKVVVWLPLVVVPLLALVFHGLGGGTGVKGNTNETVVKGLNMSLPEAKFDPRKKVFDKLGFYKQADQDSLKMSQRRKVDPYYEGGLSLSDAAEGRGSGSMRLAPDSDRRFGRGRPSSVGGLSGLGPGPSPLDQQSDELLRKLDQLKGVLNRQESRQDLPGQGLAGRSRGGEVVPPSGYHSGGGLGQGVAARQGLPVVPRASLGDPDLDKLSGMLDKILRIQHPEQGVPMDTDGRPVEGRLPGVLSTVPKEDGVGTKNDIPGLTGERDVEGNTSGSGFMELDGQGSDSVAENIVEAVIAYDQTLVSGESVELRLSQEAVIGGTKVPMGTVMTGKASLSGERLLVSVSSIRVAGGVVPVALEVLDLDGVPGIREKGSINRDASKESANEAINTLGVTSLDPSLGGQAAAAGLQAAKSLLSRKVRLVRVSLPAGYRVLLRNLKK